MSKVISTLRLAALALVVSANSFGGERAQNDTDILKRLQTEDSDITWDTNTIVSGDVDCDGKEDVAILGYGRDDLDFLKKGKNYLKLVLFRGGSNDISTLEIGLGNSMSQGSLCDSKAVLSITSQDYDLKEEFGSNPEGFVRSKSCKGLNIRGADGGCDSFHIFWNHKTGELNWWRR